MKKFFLLLFFSLAVKGQDVVAYEPNTEIVNAEAGIIIPVGKLSDKFDFAQSYGFWFKVIEEKGIVLNAGFTAKILNSAKAINYKFKDSVYTIDSNKFGFDIGIRPTKIIPISANQKSYLELGLTIGFDCLIYDYPSEETACNEKDSDNEDSIFKNGTVLLAPEIKFIHKNVGLKFQYRYAPYNLNEEFESKFGSSSISFGIVYKQ